MNVTMHKGKRMTKAQELESIALLKYEQEQFAEWVHPFFAPRMRRLTVWKIAIPDGGVSFWCEDALGLRVMCSGQTYGDGRRWLHVSMSRATRLPSWADMKRVKADFLGNERTAIQVFPPQNEWVSDHPYVLHLWSCFDGEVLPDFRSELPNGIVSI